MFSFQHGDNGAMCVDINFSNISELAGFFCFCGSASVDFDRENYISYAQYGNLRIFGMCGVEQ